jgi:hypothetical protein
MMQNKHTGLLIAASVLAFGAACSESKDSAVTQQDTVAVIGDKSTVATSPGKPSAPIFFRYEVLGTPIVGQPVSINVFVSSSVVDAPITLLYRVNDASSMLFPESQALRAEFTMAPDDDPRSQQITVVPPREGRLYLNVSAEIATADGTMLKSTSIPIQVGSAPPELETNGELVETPEGETVISMPAEQSN